MISSAHNQMRHGHCNDVTMLLLHFLTVSVLLLSAQSTAAQSNQFSKMAYVDSIMSTFYIEDCCGSTTDKCIKEKPQCTIAEHLYEFTDWLSTFDAPTDSILKYLTIRYKSFADTTTYAIDTANLQRAGKADAPITIVTFVSANCPACKRSIGDLYDSVTIGGLNGKAKLYAKMYGGGIGNKALVAAMEDGTFWKLFTALRHRRGLLKEEKDVLSLADSLGIASKSFKSRLNAPVTEQRLAAFKKEGKRLNIKYTPAIFINGKKYTSHKRAHWITDAVLYEMERKKQSPQK